MVFIDINTMCIVYNQTQCVSHVVLSQGANFTLLWKAGLKQLLWKRSEKYELWQWLGFIHGLITWSPRLAVPGWTASIMEYQVQNYALPILLWNLNTVKWQMEGGICHSKYFYFILCVMFLGIIIPNSSGPGFCCLGLVWVWVQVGCLDKSCSNTYRLTKCNAHH